MAIRFFHSFVGKTVHCEPHPITFQGEIYSTKDADEIKALENAQDVFECDESLNVDKDNEQNKKKEQEKLDKAAKKEQEKLEREEEKKKEAEEKKAAEDAKKEGVKNDDAAPVDSLGDGNTDAPAAF